MGPPPAVEKKKKTYADRKSLLLDRVTVTLRHSKIHAEDCAECETREGMLDQIDRVISIEGALDADAMCEANGGGLIAEPLAGSPPERLPRAGEKPYVMPSWM